MTFHLFHENTNLLLFYPTETYKYAMPEVEQMLQNVLPVILPPDGNLSRPTFRESRRAVETVQFRLVAVVLRLERSLLRNA